MCGLLAADRRRLVSFDISFVGFRKVNGKIHFSRELRRYERKRTHRKWKITEIDGKHSKTNNQAIVLLGNTILVKLELWESVMVIIFFGLPLTYAYGFGKVWQVIRHFGVLFFAI